MRKLSVAAVSALFVLQALPSSAEGELANANPDLPSEKPPVAFDAVYKPAIASAKKALAEKLDKLTKTDKNSASEAASKLAACEFAEEDFKSAALHLNQAIKLLSDTAPNQKSRLVGLHKHLGDCEIIEGPAG